MITLFHRPKTRATRFIFLLEELEAPYTVRTVTTRNRDGSGAADPANPHPHGKVPAISDDGVVVFGSGPTTHNLRDWMGNRRRQEPLRYAQQFAEWLQGKLAAQDTDALVAYRERAPDAVRAHPSEEHFLPLFVALGAAGSKATAERIIDGYEAGALAVDSYLFRSVASARTRQPAMA